MASLTPCLKMFDFQEELYRLWSRLKVGAVQRVYLTSHIMWALEGVVQSIKKYRKSPCAPGMHDPVKGANILAFVFVFYRKSNRAWTEYVGTRFMSHLLFHLMEKQSKLMKRMVRISLKWLTSVTSGCPLFGFILCVVISMWKDFDGVNHTHCNVN